MTAKASASRIEFGDFQTPQGLAAQACAQLLGLGVKPGVVIEPTCGQGSFIRAAIGAFPDAEAIYGIEINPEYADAARIALASSKVHVVQGDCFKLDWSDYVGNGRPLVLGNPPWVTSATIGSLDGANLPEKHNFQNRKGLDALTGKSNFDISEWMLLRAIEWLAPRDGQLAMLVKTSVARKVLLQIWRKRLPVERAVIWDIDAKEHFDASVPACFFFLSLRSGFSSRSCLHYASLAAEQPERVFGEADGILVADMECFQRWKHLRGKDARYTWRSGVKHDCAAVMELVRDGNVLRNGLGELVDIEEQYVFPMLKSSHVARGDTDAGRCMIVPQSQIGEDTASIARLAPKTWAYLNRHGERFEARRSSIYQGKPSFSIFGVGPYSFAPWKVAISGLYKKLHFTVIPPLHSKPVILDDTVYFLACNSAEEAFFVVELLNSLPAREFYESLIFWSEKRPVTTEILRALSLGKVAREVGLLEAYLRASCLEGSLPLFAAE